MGRFLLRRICIGCHKRKKKKIINNSNQIEFSEKNNKNNNNDVQALAVAAAEAAVAAAYVARLAAGGTHAAAATRIQAATRGFLVRKSVTCTPRIRSPDDTPLKTPEYTPPPNSPRVVPGGLRRLHEHVHGDSAQRQSQASLAYLQSLVRVTAAVERRRTLVTRQGNNVPVAGRGLTWLDKWVAAAGPPHLERATALPEISSTKAKPVHNVDPREHQSPVTQRRIRPVSRSIAHVGNRGVMLRSAARAAFYDDDIDTVSTISFPGTPGYMAPTQSARAKVRSRSNPKQRDGLHVSSSQMSTCPRSGNATPVHHRMTTRNVFY